MSLIYDRFQLVLAASDNVAVASSDEVGIFREGQARVRGHGAGVRKDRLFADGFSMRIRGVCLSGDLCVPRLGNR